LLIAAPNGNAEQKRRTQLPAINLRADQRTAGGVGDFDLKILFANRFNARVGSAASRGGRRICLARRIGRNQNQSQHRQCPTKNYDDACQWIFQ
jgi:hypothetical protein